MFSIQNILAYVKHALHYKVFRIYDLPYTIQCKMKESKRACLAPLKYTMLSKVSTVTVDCLILQLVQHRIMAFF